MYYGVILGHYSPIKLKDKEWGNGLTLPQINRKLTPQEIDSFISETQKVNLEEKQKAAFLDYLKKNQ